MSNPLGAILAGLGRGATVAGEIMQDKKDRAARAALMALAQQRADRANDFGTQLQLLREGYQPTAALRALAGHAKGQATDASGMVDAPLNVGSAPDMGLSALAARGVAPAMEQDAEGMARIAEGPSLDVPFSTGTESYTVNPEQTPEARRVREHLSVQQAMDRRQALHLLADQQRAEQQAAAKAIDPEIMQRALAGDVAAMAQVLVKRPELQTMFLRANPRTDPATVERNREAAAARGQYQRMLQNRPKSSQYRDPLTMGIDTPALNDAMTNWRADSTQTADYVKSFGGHAAVGLPADGPLGGHGGPVPTKAVDFVGRTKQLKAEGLSRQAAIAILTAEGWDVNTGQRHP